MPDLIIVSPREQGGMNYIYIMEKKEYLSPEMKEVEISSTAILAGSSCGGQYSPGGGCEQCDDPESDDYGG